MGYPNGSGADTVSLPIEEEFSMKLWEITLAIVFALAFMLVGPLGCGSDANCETRWTCRNGVCTCDTGPEEGEGCTQPDQTTEDDEANCDNYCHYCD